MNDLGEVPERIARVIRDVKQSWDHLDTTEIADRATLRLGFEVTEAIVVRVLDAMRTERREGSAA